MQVAEALFFTKRSEQDTDQSPQIGFNAHSTGNEITIEISFSQSVPSGAVALLQDTVHHLYGSVSLQEKDAGKISSATPSSTIPAYDTGITRTRRKSACYCVSFASKTHTF